MDLKDVDWVASEESKQIRRPFTVKIEEDVARGFIAAVHSVPGLFVRETMLKLMRLFVQFSQEGGLKDVERRDVEEIRRGNGTGSSESGDHRS